jgi:diketogulonate reductase-like aldo/keto reductase
MMTRRTLLAAALAACGRKATRRPPDGHRPLDAAVAADAAAPPPPEAAEKDDAMIIRRPIPSTGEEVPAVGLGSWQTFDVDGDEVAEVQPVVEQFLALGGRVIDSSPMYGKAEAAIGTMLGAIRPAAPPFLATKVWTEGKKKGVEQMKRSLARLGVSTLDLMQIHNLVDWEDHLATLRAWKEAGTVRYIGITHYDHGAFDEMERIVEKEKIDFVQLPYSVVDRKAEKRLLPAAADAGVAVLVMTPFESGALFDKVKGRALPDWAAELDCTSWAQLFLKFLLGHPTVTCPIPATSKVKHVVDNLGAMRGRIPDEAMRARIVKEVG